MWGTHGFYGKWNLLKKVNGLRPAKGLLKKKTEKAYN